jgi:hypothetical protein
MKSLVLIIVLLISALCATAGVLTVEKDGSGDYEIIQYAVEAAASGDTILIGPGRWEQQFLHQAPAWSDSAVIVVYSKDLAIIGSGIGETYVGTDYLPEFINQGPMGIAATYDSNLYLSNFTIEHRRVCIYFYGENLTLENMELSRCDYGLQSYASGSVAFSSCEFDSTHGGAILSFTEGDDIIDGLLAENCVLTNSGARMLSTQNTPNIRVVDCVTNNPSESYQFDQQSYGVIENCIHDPQPYSWYMLLCYRYSEMELINFRGEASNICINVDTGATVTGEGNDITGASLRVVLNSWGFMDLHNSHLIPSGDGDYVVALGTPGQWPLVTIDLTNNWWGTADADSIAAGMIDAVYDPEQYANTVIYEPFLIGPVANQKATMGNMKMLFR